MFVVLVFLWCLCQLLMFFLESRMVGIANTFGSEWFLLVQIGWCWIRMVGIGSEWLVLAQNGWYWLRMVGSYSQCFFIGSKRWLLV